MNLAKCLEKAGDAFTQGEKAFLSTRAAEYTKQGLNKRAAEISAVKDLLQHYEAALNVAEKSTVAANLWDEEFSEQQDGSVIEFKELEPDFQKQWIDAVGNNKATQELADKLAAKSKAQAFFSKKVDPGVLWDREFSATPDHGILEFRKLDPDLQKQWHDVVKKGTPTQAIADDIINEQKRRNTEEREHAIRKPSTKSEMLPAAEAQSEINVGLREVGEGNEKQKPAKTQEEKTTAIKQAFEAARAKKEAAVQEEATTLKEARERAKQKREEDKDVELRAEIISKVALLNSLVKKGQVDGDKAIDVIFDVKEALVDDVYGDLKAALKKLDAIIQTKKKPASKEQLRVEKEEIIDEDTEDDFELGITNRKAEDYHTAPSFREFLEQHFDKQHLAAAIKNGRLNIIENGAELPSDIKQQLINTYGVNTLNRFYGLYAHKRDAVYFIANNVRKATAYGSVLHEIGVHAGLENLLGSTHKKIIAELNAVADKVSKNNAYTTPLEETVYKALKRIPANTIPQNRNNELVAYFVEEGAKLKIKLPLWQRIVSAIKQFLYKHGLVFNVNTPSGLDAIIKVARGAADMWLLKASMANTKSEQIYLGQEEATAPDAKRMAEYLSELERIGRVKGVPKEVKAISRGAEGEQYLFNAIGSGLVKLLRNTKLGSKALDFSNSIWERLARPMNETLNKNYFGRRLKQLLWEYDSIANNAKANYSQKLEEIAKIYLPFINQTEQNTPDEVKNAAILMRVISDDMFGYVHHNEQLQKKFADVVNSLITKIPRAVDIETLFEKLYSAQEVDAISKMFWNEALARQPGLEKGVLTATYWRLNEDNKPVQAETDIHNFTYSKEAVRIAKDSYKLLVVAALERAVSQYHKYSAFAESVVNDVANTLYLRKPSDERNALVKITDKFTDLYLQDKNTAEQFLAAIQKHIENQKQGEDTTFVAKENDAEYIKMKDTVDALSRNLNDKQREKLQIRLGAMLKNIAATREEARSFTDRAISAISQFYLSHQRSSPHRVFSRLVDEQNKPVNVDFDKYPSFVMGFETSADAKEFVDWFNSDPDTNDVWFTVINRGGEKTKAKLILEYVRNDYEALVEATAPYFDLFTFTSQLQRANVHLTATQREALIKALSKRTDKYLKSIRYRAGKGADMDIWKAYAAYLNSNAYIIANNYMQPQIDDVLYKHSWMPYEIRKEIDNVQLMRDSTEKSILLQELEEGLRITEKYKEYANNIQDLAKKSIAEYRQQAGREPTVLDNTAHLAATSYLMANISTAITQLLSLPISLIAYLGSKHDLTGFGGGYGFAQATNEFMRTLRTMSKLRLILNAQNIRKPFSAVVADIINKTPLNARDKFVWNYIIREIKEGKLQIGQVMAVTDMYWRGASVKHRKINKYIELFMKPFALSEAYIRTAAWLTAFNLAFNELKRTSPDVYKALLDKGTASYEDPIFKKMARQADAAVEHTQGIYSQWARAPWMQHGIVRALTIFLHYPLVQVQLLGALPMSGKAMYIAMLVALAGADGIPFKEDIENIIDAIVRRYPEIFGRIGSKAFSGNIKDWYIEVTNGLLGDTGGEIIRKGLLTYLTGMDVSSKLGFSGFVRGIDAGQYGDTFALLGPIGGFADAALTSTGNAANAIMAIALGRDPTEYLIRTAKSFPVSAIRNATNGVLIARTGEARTKTGETVATNLDYFDAFHQFLGWRPIEAVEEYSIRDRQQIYKDLDRILTENYNRKLALAKADGDMKLFAQIRQEITELNQIYKDANIPLHVRIDLNNINKIAQAARETLSRRAQKRLPKELQLYFEEQFREAEEEEEY